MPAKRYTKKSKTTFRRKSMPRRRKSTFTKRRYVSKRAAKVARKATTGRRISTYNGANAVYITLSCEVPFTIPLRQPEQEGSDGLESYHFMFGTHNDALRQTVFQTPGSGATHSTRVYGWNFPVGLGQYTQLYRSAQIVSHTLQWVPGTNLPNTVGVIDGPQDQAGVRGPMPAYGKINIIESNNVVPDMQHPRYYMDSHATIKRDPLRPFTITRKCNRTYIEPSMWQHLPHSKARYIGSQPGFFNFAPNDNNVKNNAATPGQQIVTKWFEAYQNKAPSGFVVSYDVLDVPSNLELGYFKLSWRVKLSGMYRADRFSDDMLRYQQRFNETTKVSEWGLYYKGVPLVNLTDRIDISSNNADVAKNIARDEKKDELLARVFEEQLSEQQAKERASRVVADLSEVQMNYLNDTYAPFTVSDP